MAKTKATEEVKEAPILKIGGGGDNGDDSNPDEVYPIDRIVVRGKSCIASIEIDLNANTVSGYVYIEEDDQKLPFWTQI